jgi:hypothetical protein
MDADTISKPFRIEEDRRCSFAGGIRLRGNPHFDGANAFEDPISFPKRATFKT